MTKEKEELQAQMQKLMDEANKLKQQIESLKEVEPLRTVRPLIGQRYFYINNAASQVNSYEFNGDWVDNFEFLIGMASLSRAGAELLLRQMKTRAKMTELEYQQEGGPVDPAEATAWWVIGRCLNGKGVEIDNTQYGSSVGGSGKFRTMEAAENALKVLGEAAILELEVNHFTLKD